MSSNGEMPHVPRLDKRIDAVEKGIEKALGVLAETMDKNLDDLKEEVALAMKKHVGVNMDGKRRGTVRTKIKKKIQDVFWKEVQKHVPPPTKLDKAK